MKRDKQQTIPNVLKRFARVMGTEMKTRRLNIPEKFGSGYCAGFVFNDHIRMLILNYQLNENLVIENPDLHASARMILFKFQNVLSETGTLSTEKHLLPTSSVLVTTSSMNTDAVIEIHVTTASVNIEVDANYLNGLFDLPEKSPVLQSLLENSQPLLFEQMMYPSLQQVVDEIVSEPVDETFELFFLRVKAEELICKLLMKLEKRDETHLYPLHIQDIQAIYKVKEQMLAQLETPPVIKELAVGASMSSSKLKRLFKQIFGNSIFNYYQEARMKEAALLLKEGKRSVSDVGYQLGFTNLSHFSRVFEAHVGMKPKKYSTL